MRSEARSPPISPRSDDSRVAPSKLAAEHQSGTGLGRSFVFFAKPRGAGPRRGRIMLAPVDDDALAVGGPHVDAEGEMRPRAAFASTKPQVAAAQRVVAPAA